MRRLHLGSRALHRRHIRSRLNRERDAFRTCLRCRGRWIRRRHLARSKGLPRCRNRRAPHTYRRGRAELRSCHTGWCRRNMGSRWSRRARSSFPCRKGQRDTHHQSSIHHPRRRMRWWAHGKLHLSRRDQERSRKSPRMRHQPERRSFPLCMHNLGSSQHWRRRSHRRGARSIRCRVRS